MIIPDIYVARSDIETGTVDVVQFVADIAAASHVEAMHGLSLQQTETMLRGGILHHGDVLITMGAGPITALSDTLLH